VRQIEGDLVTSGGRVPGAQPSERQLKLRMPKPGTRHGSGAREPATLVFEIVSPLMRITQMECAHYLPLKRGPSRSIISNAVSGSL
jgi:hypothetical protein